MINTQWAQWYTLLVVSGGSALLGAMSGAVGSFAVLRRESLLGDALAHAALPGVAIAFLIAGRSSVALLIGAGAASLLGVGFMRIATRYSRLKEDAALGVVLAGWFAAGIVGLTLVQGRPDAQQAGLATFIFGQAASMLRGDLTVLSIAAGVVAVVLTAFWSKFKALTFDAEFVRASGMRTGVWSALLSLLLVVTIVLGLQVSGVVLMVGLLVAPGVAARLWTQRLEVMVPLAATIGAVSAAAGAAISAADSGLPTGPIIVLVASLAVVGSMLCAPRSGLISRWLRRFQDARRFAMRTVLRDIYHYAYDHGGTQSPVPDSFVVGIRGRRGRNALVQLLRQGFLVRTDRQTGSSWYLTQRGIDAGWADARNQQLWDLYREMRGQLNLPVVVEQRDRDIRAVLPATASTTLESLLEEGAGEPRVRD